MLLKDLLLALLLINCVALSSTQSCGTTQCSQEYDDTCSQDETCLLYDSCKTSKSSCKHDIMGPAKSLSVDCYDTCITGFTFDPTIPEKCCGDLISSTPNTISSETVQNYLIVRLKSLNENGVYRHNTFCKYNVECPGANYDLHYLMVRFKVEPPGVGGQCLDFLRYHFTATGATADADACGNLEDLPSALQGGVHGSALTVDFRSNRVNGGEDFFLAVICVPTTESSVVRKKRDTSVTEPTGDSLVLQTLRNCTPSLSLEKQVVRDPDIESSDEDYLDTVFPNEGDLDEDESIYRAITITRTGVVKYNRNTITVKQDGKISKFKKIKRLQLYNTIEGYLTFNGSSSPRRRQFPGYGFLRIRKGFAQYYQTLVDPKNLLNDDEESIVRELFQELYNRQTLNDDEKIYSIKHRLTVDDERVNCTINELAELNSQSCTDVLRAAANLYLEQDTFQEFCNSDR